MAIQGVFYVYAAVSDLARAKKFYGETLGFRLNTDEPYVGGFWFGSGYLVIGAMAPATGSGGTHVAVRVDDVDAEHSRLAQRGVAVGPVQDQPWGERNFRFSDPDGNVWVYAQPIET
ncbi:MAG: VOC family protein [Deltaproteobacteria bacterium]|nr:VOC family protein [Deltaproteobacteria bacterium]